MTARHDAVLRSLKPMVLGAQDSALLAADATYLDAAQDALAAVLDDAFILTTSSLSRWEALYGLSGAGNDSVRRARILAAMASVGGLSKRFFLDLATSMGYTITIENGVAAFRAGIGVADDPVYSLNTSDIQSPPEWDQSQGDYPPDLWVWTVTIVSLGVNQNSDLLKARFESLKPAYSTIKWI